MRVPLIPCFLPVDGNATSTIPPKYSSRQQDAFKCGCTNGVGPTSGRGSQIYEINNWLWKFGWSQGGLSVATTAKSRRKSRSEASKRSWATKKASTDKWPLSGIYMLYAWYIVLYTWYTPGISCFWVKHIFLAQLSCCPVIQHYVHVLPTSIASM